MDFIDDEVDISDDNDVLIPSSQQISSIDDIRPTKRRRLRGVSDNENVASASDEYDLPSNDAEAEDEFDNPRSKYDAVIHVPAYADVPSNEFVSQIEQPWSSPTAIRGPRWQKKNLAPSPTPVKTAGPEQNSTSTTSRFTAAPRPASGVPMVVDEFDDDELEALMAGGDEQILANSQTQPKRVAQQPKAMRQTTLFGMSTTQRDAPVATQNRSYNWPMASRNEPPTHHDIDKAAMQTWIYPLNVGTIREYQFNIVHRALFHNILVALPTGLGKTFIAATVMLNYFNWTKNSQIVFVAPTKPLVTQQVNACFHIAGIPRSQTTLLTGEIQPAVRAEEWQDKRVFFMTPQTLINDLKTGMADPKKIVLVVVDEAHKATGNYAYVEVVKFLRRFNSSFRVLALTATPGSNVEAVQKVIDGLGIARVEIRTEESIDIRSFVHARNENVEIFDNSEEIEMCLDLFATAVRPVLTKVSSLNAYFSNDPKTMTLYGLMKGREQWSKSEVGRRADWGLKGMVQSCFKPLMSLAHNLELLKFHGIGPFCHKMKVFDEEAPGLGKYAKQIVESESYKTLMNRLRAWVNDDNFVGHPKLTYLNEVVLNHFMDAGDGLGAAAGRPPSDTRIMVFAHYRDSAEEIVRVLNRHQPMIRAHVFVGQSGTKGSEGMDQKTQIDMIKKFKAGTYNTLVATSIGEEGLDIGEVDLIVCYDCSKSPIRMLQRMGRTGRKRAGNIVLLLMRGKEERDYHAAKDNYLKMQAIIESGKDFQFHDDLSPRIVPKEVQPVVDKRHVDIPIENTQAESPEPRRKKAKKTKRPPKKFHMPDNVETGFQFLGHGKKRKDSIASKTAVRRVADQQEATLPDLRNILLSEKDEEYLERHYAQIAGSETQYVQAVKLDAFPEAIRHASKTRLVEHSTTTKRLVQASQAMHSCGRVWERPEGSSVIGRPSSSHLQGRTTTRTSIRGAATNGSSSKVGSALTTINREDESHSDSVSENHVPKTRTLTKLSAALFFNTASGKDDGTTSDRIVDKPFYVSQQSVRADDSDIDELPSMNELVTNTASRKTKALTRALGGHDGRSNTRIKRSRKILSDDSDE